MRRAYLVVGLLSLLGSSCVTPAVPVPPPEAENMAFAVDADAGVARFAFGPEPTYGGAIVYVFNRSRGAGVIETAQDNGSVPLSAPFPAQIGDQIVVTFELEIQSVSTCVELRDGPSSSELECVF